MATSSPWAFIVPAVSPTCSARASPTSGGLYIAATSANISGRAAATDAYEVKSQFGSKVDIIFDGGKTPGTIGSTIIGREGKSLKLIREGVIPFKEILKVSKK